MHLICLLLSPLWNGSVTTTQVNKNGEQKSKGTFESTGRQHGLSQSNPLITTS